MKILAMLMFMPFLAISLFAQSPQESEKPIDSTKDSINFDEYSFDKSPFGFSMDWMKFDNKNYVQHDAPTIELFYGNSTAGYDHKLFSSELADNGFLSVNLGSTDIYKFEKDPSIVEYDYTYLTFANYTRDLLSKDEDAGDKIRTRQWRANISSADGYGWNFGDQVYFILYHSEGIGWSALDVVDKPTDADSRQALGVFGKQIRYGKQFSGGAKIYITKNFALNAEYEKSMIYPRHMFWKDMVGSIVEGSAQGLAGWFTGEVAERAPLAAPIVHFLVKNAVSYGFYELYKEKMNWPMKTAAPFMTENFKVGVNFTF